jgi:hypothetical protein
MAGQKPMDQVLEEQRAIAKDKADAEYIIIPIPAEKFSDYKEINKDNEDEFEYVINAILVQFFEKFNDRALEFPACIPSDGRALIHSICSYIGMPSHSVGSAKTRRIMVYPRHMYPERQEKELRDREKEKEKLRARFEAQNFPPLIMDNPVSMRDKLIKEVWCEIKGLPVPESEKPWTGPVEVRLQDLRKKMQTFEDNAGKLMEDSKKK